MPLTVIGAGSNLIIRDGGVPGVVVRLARAFGAVAVEADGVWPAPRRWMSTVAEHAAAAGSPGWNSSRGIPGQDRRRGGDERRRLRRARPPDVLDWAEVATPPRRVRLPAAAIPLRLPPRRAAGRAVVMRARLRARARRAARHRRAHGGDPRGARGDAARPRPHRRLHLQEPARRRKAWELIDAAGCRGLVRGGAQVSEKHCNFLINTGGATAADIEGAGRGGARAACYAATGVALEWEIKRIGVPAKRRPA